MKRAASLSLPLLLLLGCSPTGPDDACPPVGGSIPSLAVERIHSSSIKVRISESGGVGFRILSLEIRYHSTCCFTETSPIAVELRQNDLEDRIGTSRIEANGSVYFELPIEHLGVTAAEMTYRDDRDNTCTVQG